MANFSPSIKLSATRNIGDCFSLPVASSVYVPPAVLFLEYILVSSLLKYLLVLVVLALQSCGGLSSGFLSAAPIDNASCSIYKIIKLSATRNIGDCFSLPVASSVYVPPAEH
jgi:hypothetical protein